MRINADKCAYVRLCADNEEKYQTGLTGSCKSCSSCHYALFRTLLADLSEALSGRRTCRAVVSTKADQLSPINLPLRPNPTESDQIKVNQTIEIWTHNPGSGPCPFK